MSLLLRRFIVYILVLVIAGIISITMFGPSLVWEPSGGPRPNYHVQRIHDILTAPVMFGKINPDRKYAVFSTTSAGNAESLGFIFLLPLTALAWKRIGFDSVVMIARSSNVWLSNPLLYTVLNSVRELDAIVVFLDVHPVNSVMVSQVRNLSFLPHLHAPAVYATAILSVRLSHLCAHCMETAKQIIYINSPSSHSRRFLTGLLNNW